MQSAFKYTAYALIAAGTITACRPEDDDPATPTPPVNEEELITTLSLHFHSSGGVEHKHFNFVDLDGDGGDPPSITTEPLSADSVYHVHIEVLNASGSTVEDITEEIEEEAAAHQFFFQVSGANATVAYEDADPNGMPIGLETEWTVGGVSSGSIVVTLRHGPDKHAPGVSGGDITNAGGETDIEVSFPLVIE